MKKYENYLIIFFVAILVIILITRYQSDFSNKISFEKITVRFKSPISKKINIYAKLLSGNTQPFVSYDYKEYSFSFLPVKNIVIKTDSFKNLNFDIIIGKKIININPKNFNYYFKKKAPDTYISFFKNTNTINPAYKKIINWNGDFKIFINVFITFIKLMSIVFFLLILKYILRIKPIERKFAKIYKKYGFLFNENKLPNTQFDYTFTKFFGLLLTLSIFAFLEFRDNYFFTQDDTFSQFLPVILQGMKDFFSFGKLPTFNPFQFRGIPTFSVAYYSFANPLMYISYFIANFILKNKFLTVEIFALIHFIIAYFGIFSVLKRFKLIPPILILASISYLFSGYNIIAGRSWYYMLSAMAFAPYLLILAIDFGNKETINLDWILKVTFVLALLFYAGNIQMWIYAIMLFSFLVALNLIENFNLQKLLSLIFSFSLIGAIIFPLFINQVFDCKIAARNAQHSLSFLSFLGLLLPYPILKDPNPYLNFHSERIIQLFYNGTIFNLITLTFIFFLILFLLSKFNSKEKKKIIFNNKLLLISLLVLLLMRGKYGILNEILTIFPPFNKFTRIFKYVLYFNLFSISAGAVILNKMYEKKKKAFSLVLILSYLLIAYHIYITDIPFYKFGDKPYPKLPDYIAKLFKPHSNYRILGNAVLRSGEKNYTTSLQLNFASIYEIPSLTGYDIFENFTIKQPEKNLGELGVKYVVDSDFKTTFPQSFKSKLMLHNKMKFLFGKKNQKIFELEEYKPLVMVNRNKNIKIYYTNQGIKFDISGFTKIDSIFINYKFRKRLKAYIDGQQITIEKTKNNSILAIKPKTGKIFELKYDVNLGLFSFVSLVLIVIFSFLYYLIVKKIKEQNRLTQNKP